MDLLTPSNIVFLIGIIGTVFGVYNLFHKPQQDLEKKQIVFDKDISNKATILAQKEMENKADLLSQQVKLTNETNEKKFTELGLRLDNSTKDTQKEIHDLDIKLEVFTSSQTVRNEEISKSLMKLFTILEERLPGPLIKK